MKMLQVRNWAKFQHYKDRCPPWIKLHWEILASEDWVMLADDSKLLAVVCMLIASRNDGMVPDNPDYIKRVGYLNKRPNLKPLIECGFLENLQADASASKQEQADDTTETETETYIDVEKDAAPKKIQRRATALPEDWEPNDRNAAFADKHNLDCKSVALKFKSHHLSKGSTYKDWDMAWQTWCLNAVEWGQGKKQEKIIRG